MILLAFYSRITSGFCCNVAATVCWSVCGYGCFLCWPLLPHQIHGMMTVSVGSVPKPIARFLSEGSSSVVVVCGLLIPCSRVNHCSSERYQSKDPHGFVTTRPRKVKMAPSLFSNGTSCFNNSVYHAYAYRTHVVVVYDAYAYRTRMVAVHFYDVQICLALCPHN